MTPDNHCRKSVYIRPGYNWSYTIAGRCYLCGHLEEEHEVKVIQGGEGKEVRCTVKGCKGQHENFDIWNPSTWPEAKER